MEENKQRMVIQSLRIPKTLYTPLLSAVIIFLLLMVATSIYFFIGPPEVPLFYSLARPEQQLTPKAFIFILPVVSGLFIFLHVVLIKILHEYDALLLALFAWVTVIIQVLLTIAFIRIFYITM